MKITATKIGVLLAAALLTTGCDDKKGETPEKAPEKTPAADAPKDSPGAAAKPEEDKDTVAAKEEGEDGAKEDGAAKDDKKGKEGSCGEGKCGEGSCG